jgi:fatty-acyl-CoA synthase
VNRVRNLIEALDLAPEERPFITNWVDEDEQETVSFGEFRQRARAQAALLREQGVTVGDRVVIILPQGIGAMAAFVGGMLLGAVPAFLAYPNFKIEPTKYRSGLAGVTANLGAKVVVVDQEFPEELLGHMALGAQTRLLRANGAASGCEKKVGLAASGADGLAFIQHSAGTTGLQKGVALTHAAVLRQIEHLATALKIDGGNDRIYSWLPLYHDMGLIACFMLPMVCHVPVVMQSPLDWVMHPEMMLQIMTEHRCTLAWLPNFAFQFVARRTPRDRIGQYDLASLRALINCSEPVRANSMDEFRKAFAEIGLNNAALQSSYAMAENVFAVTQSDVNRESGPSRVWADGHKFRSEHRIVKVTEKEAGAICFTSSGSLLPNQEIRILSDSGADVAAGYVGEILIKGDCLFGGYYNRPDLSDQAMVDGWYRTGDLGFYLDGELYVIGRKKDLIIVGGENFYPQDIEEIVCGCRDVHDGRAIAMGIYNPELGTEEITVVAEVESEELLERAAEIEQDICRRVVGGIGVSVKTIYLKPPKWIVKSTAGKAARTATKEKLLTENPELNGEAQESPVR